MFDVCQTQDNGVQDFLTEDRKPQLVDVCGSHQNNQVRNEPKRPGLAAEQFPELKEFEATHPSPINRNHGYMNEGM